MRYPNYERGHHEGRAFDTGIDGDSCPDISNDGIEVLPLAVVIGGE